jgi:hypothetical protein
MRQAWTRAGCVQRLSSAVESSKILSELDCQTKAAGGTCDFSRHLLSPLAAIITQHREGKINAYFPRERRFDNAQRVSIRQCSTSADSTMLDNANRRFS